jgi:hypothetical protein
VGIGSIDTLLVSLRPESVAIDVERGAPLDDADFGCDAGAECTATSCSSNALASLGSKQRSNMPWPSDRRPHAQAGS